MKSWPTDEGKFVYEYRVTGAAADIDENDHVNNVVYVRWVQEAATAHWRAAADKELVESIVWVVMSHEIEYKKPAMFDDKLLIKTWVEEGTALTSERHCRILRESDNTLIARVKTLWCAINPMNGKPKRLDPRVREIFVR